MTSQEKDVLTEFIDLYRDLPCLWDLSSDGFKDASQKKVAWGILVEKLKELDPNANELSAKKKVDHLKYSYQREVKKIKESKNRTGSAASEVYRPNLWYFEHLSFLEKKKNAKRTGVDILMEEDEIECTTKKRKQTKEDILEEKKHKLMDTAQALMKQNENKTSSFGTYVSEKLEKIAPGQQEIAEKLISDVLFLAQTNRLSFDSRVETLSYSQGPQHNSEPYFSDSHHFSSHNSAEYPSYMLQTNRRRFSAFSQSPPSHIHRQQRTSYCLSQSQAASPSSNSVPIQSPPPSSDIQYPQSPLSYQIPHPADSPSASSVIHIQSPTLLSDIQHPQPSPSSNIIHIQSPPPNINNNNQGVFYAEGPAGEILQELLIFNKNNK